MVVLATSAWISQEDYFHRVTMLNLHCKTLNHLNAFTSWKFKLKIEFRFDIFIFGSSLKTKHYFLEQIEQNLW